MRIMLAVPTRGRYLYLSECLDSLSYLKVPQQVEITFLLVDNNDTPLALETVEPMLAKLPFLSRRVWEPSAGIVFARNRALKAALEEGVSHLAFIDDDETVTESWLNDMVSQLQVTGAEIVTGPVVSLFRSRTPEWIRLTSLFRPRQERPIRGLIRGPAYTGNVIFSMEIVRRGGLRFEESFNFSGGEDVVFFRRAEILGYTTAWLEKFLVFEQVPPTRACLKWILQRRYRHGHERLQTADALGATKVERAAVLLRAALSVIGGVLLIPAASLIGLHKGVDAAGLVADGLGAWGAALGIGFRDYQIIHGS